MPHVKSRSRWFPRILMGFVPLLLLGLVVVTRVSGDSLPAAHPQNREIRASQDPSPAHQAPSLGKRISEKEKLVGLIAVMGAGFFFLVFPVANQKISGRDLLTVYRQYELKMIQNGRMKLQDLLEYHGQYHWGDYAAVSSGMVLVAVILVIQNSSDLTPMDRLVQIVMVTFMTLSTICLCWADLVHTNTQSPIVPLRRRFKLIDLSVSLGTAGTMLMVFAIMACTVLLSLGIVVICAIAYCVLVFVVYRARRIDKKELFNYFKIHSPTLWPAEGADGRERQEGNAFSSTGDGKTYADQDESYIVRKPTETDGDNLDIPYSWEGSGRMELYRRLVAVCRGKQELDDTVNKARLCLGISDREHMLLNRQITCDWEAYEGLRQTALAAGADSGIGDIIEKIGLEVGYQTGPHGKA